MKIIYLEASQAALLLVYTLNNALFQYQILFHNSLLYHPPELYCTAFTALEVARKRIELLTGYSE